MVSVSSPSFTNRFQFEIPDLNPSMGGAALFFSWSFLRRLFLSFLFLFFSFPFLFLFLVRGVGEI